MEQYQTQSYSAPQASSRGGFIMKTYGHVVGALFAFVGLEIFLFSSGIAAAIAAPLANNWLIVLGAMVLVSFLVSRFATPEQSLGVQYLILAAFVVMEAVIFVPLLAVAGLTGGSALLMKAVYITLAMVAALSAVVFIFRQNFSFLAPFLAILGIAALVLIASSLIFGFELGIFFTIAMIVYASGAILYETSKVLHTHRDQDYVLAAIGLLTSVLLLLWYVVQGLLGSTSE